MRKIILVAAFVFVLQFVCATTYDEASLSINSSQAILQEFREAGFSVGFINDTIIESKIVLEQAKYAEILRNSSSSEALKQEARSALRLVEWKNIGYDNVLTYYSTIESRKKQAYETYDSLSVLNKKIVGLKSRGLSIVSVMEIFNQANISFYEDRYNESLSFMGKADSEIEKINSENAAINILGQNAKTFIYKNRIYILICLVVIFMVVYFGYKRVMVLFIFRKINRMKMDLVVLRGLLIKNQTDRFRDNKISALVYNIRAQKYEQRINQIKEELPVFESRLVRFKNKKLLGK